MDDDRVEGKLKQGEGELQETWGDAKEKVGADGEADQSQGKAKQGEGELQETWARPRRKPGIFGRGPRTSSTATTSPTGRRPRDRPALRPRGGPRALWSTRRGNRVTEPALPLVG